MIIVIQPHEFILRTLVLALASLLFKLLLSEIILLSAEIFGKRISLSFLNKMIEVLEGLLLCE